MISQCYKSTGPPYIVIYNISTCPCAGGQLNRQCRLDELLIRRWLSSTGGPTHFCKLLLLLSNSPHKLDFKISLFVFLHSAVLLMTHWQIVCFWFPNISGNDVWGDDPLLDLKPTSICLLVHICQSKLLPIDWRHFAKSTNCQPLTRRWISLQICWLFAD